MQTCKVKFKRTNRKFSLTQQLKRIITLVHVVIVYLVTFDLTPDVHIHRAEGYLIETSPVKSRKYLQMESNIYDTQMKGKQNYRICHGVVKCNIFA